jgi:CHAD domain-containing protein
MDAEPSRSQKAKLRHAPAIAMPFHPSRKTEDSASIPTPAAITRNLLRSAAALRRRHREATDRCRRRCSRAAVHELRLAGRRLLACLELLGPSIPADRLHAARRALKRQLRSTSKVRDAHVQLHAIEAMLEKNTGLTGFHDYLRHRARRKEHQLARRLESAKARAGSRALHSAFRSVIIPERRRRAPSARDAPESIRRITGLLRGQPLRPARLHQVRLALKQFRYRAEAFATASAAHFPLEELHACQTLLGEVRDLSLLEARLRHYCAKHNLHWQQWAQVRQTWAKERRARLRSCRQIVGNIV